MGVVVTCASVLTERGLRALFWIYSTVIALGLAYFIVIGDTHPTTDVRRFVRALVGQAIVELPLSPQRSLG